MQPRVMLYCRWLVPCFASNDHALSCIILFVLHWPLLCTTTQCLWSTSLAVRSIHPMQVRISFSITRTLRTAHISFWYHSCIEKWCALGPACKTSCSTSLSLLSIVSWSSEHLAVKGVHRDWHGSWVSVHDMDKTSHLSAAEEICIGWNESHAVGDLYNH